MKISLIVLFLVFMLSAIRKIGPYTVKIWQIMFAGAIIVVSTGEISIFNAFKAVNFDVLIFLFCMFYIGEAMDKSGYLNHLTYKIFHHTKTSNELLLSIIFSMGLFASLLMNDTIAIIGTPLVLYFSEKRDLPAKPLLLALCFSITIGSVMSPIGNPQNLLIALSMPETNSFILFAKYLIIPTILNLFVLYLLIKTVYKNYFNSSEEIDHTQEPVEDHKMALLCRFSLILILIAISFKILLVFFDKGENFSLTYIALIGFLPLFLFGSNQKELLRKMDWATLLFFASMFILMASVWDTEFFQKLLKDIRIDNIPVIMLLSVTVSQAISNVPFVALFIPVLKSLNANNSMMMALAAGSTIAGNLFILGAASNVIVIHNAEKKGQTLTFKEFAVIGIPLTIINIVLYYIYFMILNIFKI